MNKTMQALRARKSVRVFEPRPVSPDIKRELLEAAFEAPTAGNQMLYTILDITDEKLKAQLAESCDGQSFIASAPLVFIFLADCRRWLDTYRAAGVDARMPGQGDVLLAMQDAVIAAQNMVVAAESFDLGSCYIGDILENVEQIRAMLNLPEEVLPAAMLVLGYPTAQQKARKKPARFNGKYIVLENGYRTLTPEEHQAMFYDREARAGHTDLDADAFRTQTVAFCNRKYESDFSREMSRSAKIYLDAFDRSED